MKRSVFVLLVAVMALVGAQAHASVFGGGGGSALQAKFNNMGLSHINVADYQTDLNFRLQGIMEFQLLSRATDAQYKFGYLKSYDYGPWTINSHHQVFGRNASVGSTKRVAFDGVYDSKGFYLQRKENNQWRTRYSYSAYNGNFWNPGGTQALFFQDPENSGQMIIAWEGMDRRNSHSDGNYDDVIIKASGGSGGGGGVNPVPEPSTWVLLITGMAGVGAFLYTRRMG